MATLLAALVAQGCVGGIGLRYTDDPELFPEPPRDAITFWGHACMYIDIDGVGMITDPVFEPVYASFHRRYISSPPLESFDQTRIVLISHAHNDHLSPTTLRRFPESTIVLCPIPAAKYLDKVNLKIITMRPGEVWSFPGGEIIAVPAHHPGYRYSFKADSDGRALGYIIRTAERTLYYSGDTDYFDGIREIGEGYAPGLVLLNVNSHLNSEQALRAVKELGVRKVVPSHYGAYRGSNGRKTPGYRRELAAYLGTMWTELAVGESCTLDGEPLGGQDVIARGK